MLACVACVRGDRVRNDLRLRADCVCLRQFAFATFFVRELLKIKPCKQAKHAGKTDYFRGMDKGACRTPRPARLACRSTPRVAPWPPPLLAWR